MTRRIESVNPWGSRRAWLDDDGRTVYLHLGPVDEAWTVERSVWVRNCGEAPERVELVAVEEDGPPTPPRLEQPRKATRHPHGKPLAKGQVLELLWFEEGDAVSLFVDGELEAILPSWSSLEVRGYAVEAKGRGPVAWELTVPNPLSTRAARARAHWDALNAGPLWRHVETADLQFGEARLGPHEAIWRVSPPGEPPRAVASFRLDGKVSRAPAPLAFATLGMATQPMPGIEAEREDFALHRRAQLVFATVAEAGEAPVLLGELSRYPWRAVTFFGDGHVIDLAPGGQGELLVAAGVDDAAASERFPSALLLAQPPPDGAQPAPDLHGHRDRTGDAITYLWLVPITARERALVEERGVEALTLALDGAGHGWLHDPRRPSVA